ncbi:MAG: endolytic transglycosylase MltG [Crocinitomicaceae bacterium]|nr:endolytic transglycosylase MltG [Crocinitomicaceae bacterium]
MKYLIFSVSLIGLFMFTSCDSMQLYFDGKKHTENEEETPFFLPTGTSLKELSELLYSQQIFQDKEAIMRVGNYKQLGTEQIAAGKYIIAPSTNIKDLLNGFTMNRLGNGNAELEVLVTFNNARDIPQMAGKVAKSLELDSADLVNFIFQDSVLKHYGFSKEKIPALFLPDTYRFYWDTEPAQFVQRMAEAFNQFWTPERKAKITQIGLKQQSEVVTLAAIVYKEQSKHAEEWPIIAGLYLNRLRNGWPLQSDPTFRFCWGNKLDGVQRLTYEHREIDCPYNTYKYKGLPPGPICIPPAAVVDAVLNADKNSYFFMCAKPDGNGLHAFAKTLAEHNRNAKNYQNWLNQRNIR